MTFVSGELNVKKNYLVIATRLDVLCVSLYAAALSKQAIRTQDLQFIAHESVDNKIKRDVKKKTKKKNQTTEKKTN